MNWAQLQKLRESERVICLECGRESNPAPKGTYCGPCGPLLMLSFSALCSLYRDKQLHIISATGIMGDPAFRCLT